MDRKVILTMARDIEALKANRRDPEPACTAADVQRLVDEGSSKVMKAMEQSVRTQMVGLKASLKQLVAEEVTRHQLGVRLTSDSPPKTV